MDAYRCLKCGEWMKEYEHKCKPLSSDAVLGEGFDINTAIEDNGNCGRQNVNCDECKMGKIIFENGLKTRIDDLCDYKIVCLLSKVAKTFA